MKNKTKRKLKRKELDNITVIMMIGFYGCERMMMKHRK